METGLNSIKEKERKKREKRGQGVFEKTSVLRGISKVQILTKFCQKFRLWKIPHKTGVFESKKWSFSWEKVTFTKS